MEENLLFNNQELLLPPEAYSYFPPQHLISLGTGKNILRLFYYGVEFTPFQQFQLQQYKKLISQQFQNLPSYFTDPQLIRILIGCKFQKPKALKALKNAIQWRQSNIIDTYRTQLQLPGGLLQQGSIYLQGLDHRFRPLIVINLSRMDLKRFSVFHYCGLLCYVLDYTMKHYMIPGQVQNWIIITDLCRIGLMSLPFSDLKKIIKILQDNYRSRMIVNYVVNAPMTISSAWGVAKRFVNQQTVRKIKIIRKSQPEELKSHFNMGQIQEKYGGRAPVREEFWPPVLSGPPFHLDGDRPDEFLSGYSTYQKYHPLSQFRQDEMENELFDQEGAPKERFEEGFQGNLKFQREDLEQQKYCQNVPMDEEVYFGVQNQQKRRKIPVVVSESEAKKRSCVKTQQFQQIKEIGQIFEKPCRKQYIIGRKDG